LAKEINATSNLCTVPELNGVLVIEVVEDSPAAKAGIKPCDLIRNVNGAAVNDPSEVQLAVDRGQVGKAMPLIVERGGDQQTLDVIPEELPRRG
jgi:S1-C subfamily serine protease